MYGFVSTNKQVIKCFYVILLSTLLLNIGSNMSIPFMAIYLRKTLDASPVSIGLFVSLGFFSYSLFGMPIGKLIDRGNQKLILLVCAGMLVFSLILFFISNNLFLFYLANFVIGVSRAGFNTVVSWFITNHINDGEKYTAFSMKYIIVNVGASIGPLLGAYFAKMDSNKYLLLGAGFYFLSLILILFLVNFQSIKYIHKESLKYRLIEIFNNKLFVIFLMGSILYNICYSQCTSTFPLHIKQAMPNWVSIYASMLIINSLGVVLMQYPITIVMNKYLTTNSFVVGALAFGSSFLLLAFSDKSYLFYSAMFLFTLGEIILSPLSSVLIDKIAPPNQKGAYFGAYNLSYFGSSLGPILGGAVLQFSNGTLLYLFLTLVSIGMLGLFLLSLFGSEIKYSFA